jgi:hypothetical protein
MKKTLVVLLILAMAMGAFAQEIKFSGDLSTGLETSYEAHEQGDDNKSYEEKLKAYSYDADDDTPVRARLNIDVENENAGVHVQFRINEGKNSHPENVIPGYAYGAVKAIDIINIYAGLVSNGAWNTGGDDDSDVGEGIGALVQATPIEGLTIGAGIFGGPTRKSFLAKDPKPINKLAYAHDSSGVAYEQEKLFKIAVSGRTEEQDFAKFHAGFSFLGVEGLGLAIEAFSNDLYDKADKAWQIDEVISYDLGAIDVGLTAFQYIHQSGAPGYINFTSVDDDTKVEYAYAKDLNLGLKFNPWVSYTMGNIVPKLAGLIGFTGYDKDDVKIDVFYFRIKPSVTFKIVNNASIALAYTFDAATTTYKDIDDKLKENKHTASVDFRYSF